LDDSDGRRLLRVGELNEAGMLAKQRASSDFVLVELLPTRRPPVADVGGAVK